MVSGAWDSSAFDATQQQKPAPIFVVPDDLRRQVEFWKDRRNDCAHSKDNKITPAYVEALHAFIESNLNNIVSPFLRTLSSKYLSLTPKEIQVAGLIKEGKSQILPVIFFVIPVFNW